MRFLLVGHTICTSTCRNDIGVDNCKYYSNKKINFGNFWALLPILGHLSPTGALLDPMNHEWSWRDQKGPIVPWFELEW